MKPSDELTDSEELKNRLSAIVTSSDDAIISKTLDGMIVTWNQAAERMFGYSAEEIIGRPITTIIPADHIEEEMQILARLRAGQRIDHFQTIRRHKDGTLLDIALTVSPVRNARGEIVGASKIARDISEQKRAAEALEASNARFRIMADSAPVLIWIADSHQSNQWFNRGWLEFTGRTIEQEQGSGWLSQVHPEERTLVESTFANHFRNQQPFRCEFRLRRRDGSWRCVANQAVPLFERRGHGFSGFIGSCTDISELRQGQLDREQLLQAERAARADAERLSRMKDEFLATLSHELRTPLTAILGWCVLARRLETGSPEFKRALETIERNARIQSQIIGDLLDMSAIISGKVQLNVQPVEMRELISAALDSVGPSIEAKNLQLRTVLGDDIGQLRADPARLQQVLWNLLSNAVKFTPRDGQLKLAAERVESHIEISVTDSGIGIKPEFLAYVFDRFRQADASTTRAHGGLGLGLAIVRHLVELHGGSVRVHSPGENQGSTFVVAMPIASLAAQRTPGRSSTVAEESAVTLPTLEGVRVLIVDDEADARELVQRFIAERGADVVGAANAAEALDLLKSDGFDIMISDVGMPGTDGYQLIQAVRRLPEPRARGMLAVALTAYARAEDRQRALLAGYQMHMAKPIDPGELIAGIASLLAIRQGRYGNQGGAAPPEAP